LPYSKCGSENHQTGGERNIMSDADVDLSLIQSITNSELVPATSDLAEAVEITK
jgi:hypothetical protein